MMWVIEMAGIKLEKRSMKEIEYGSLMDDDEDIASNLGEIEPND